jgi:DNA-binding transcriptional LysR family regulator
VVDRARRINSEMEAIYADLQSLDSEVSGEARLGVIGTTARWLMPQALNALRARHPLVRVVAVEGTTTSLVPQLVGGQVDLAILNLPVDDPDLVSAPLFAEDLIVLAHGDHPLARYDEVPITELAEHELLLSPPGSPLRDELDEVAHRNGVRLRPLAEIDGVRLMTSLTMEGFGATIIPATAVPGWVKGNFKRVRVPGLPRRLVGLARRRRTVPSAPARAVAEVVTDVVLTKGERQLGVEVTARADAVGAF